jgi:hypothetical protein
VSLGTDLKRIADNSLKIYTRQDNAFKYNGSNDSTNRKEIGFMWYNKNDDNEYIGFSDGTVYIDPETDVIEDYDEIDYLKKVEVCNRLQAQRGKHVPLDRNGLEMSANVSDAEILINKVSNLIQVNLVNIINELYQRAQTLN